LFLAIQTAQQQASGDGDRLKALEQQLAEVESAAAAKEHAHAKVRGDACSVFYIV
jgi:hypothetical protein|tara:strand:+ start:422 stop:586 length:165 start_codon:yes stop_codon:yes gene_type:complete